MKPLIEITSVPIVLEYKVKNARMQRVDSNATLEVSRESGGYRMRSRPIKMNVDTMESNRRPMPRVRPGRPQVAAQPPQPAVSGGVSAPPPGRTLNTAAYSATAQLLDNGRIQVDMSFRNDEIRQSDSRSVPAGNAAESAYRQSDFPENLSIIYEIDKLSFDWSASMKNFELEFVPGDIEFSVAEYPSVTIEYLGDPVYVPPSANPAVRNLDKMA